MSSLYNTGRVGFLTEVTVGAVTEKIDWANDTIHVALLDSTYVVNPSDTNYTSIESAIVSTTVGGANSADAEVGNRSVTADGAAAADNVTFSGVDGNTVVQAVIYKRVGTDESDWPLIAHLDSGTGLPIVPNGGDITIIWGAGSGEIFRL